MNKELIDRAWACLPREFKEEVKKEYYHDDSNPFELALLENLFGRYNLTSDAEEEVILMVEKCKVQDVYKTSNEIVSNEVYGSKMYSMHLQILCVLEGLFGSKCLPDEEPKPAEPELRSDGTAHFDTILTDGFRDHNRLQITAMALQGILSNYQMLQNLTEGEITTEGVLNCVATAALRYTDALIEAASKNKVN